MLLFADDVAVHSVIKKAQSIEEAAAQIQTQLSAVNDYCLEWWLSLSVAKTKLIVFSNSHLTLEAWDQVELSAGGSKVEVTRTARYLGVTFDSRLLFNNHFDKTTSRASRRLKQLLRHGSRLNAAPLRFQVLLYQLCIRSVLEYGSHIYGFASPSQLKRLDRFQANALKQILRVHKTTNNAAVEVYCHCEPLELRRLATWATKALDRTLDKDSTARETNPTDPTHRALPEEVHGIALQRLGLDPGATVLDLRDEILKCEGWEALNEVCDNPPKSPLLTTTHKKIDKRCPRSVAAAVARFEEELSHYPKSPVLYTDGSLATSGAGIGVFVDKAEDPEFYSIPVPETTCNVRAEALALRLAATLIQESVALRSRHCVVVSDCRPAILEASKGTGMGAVTGARLRASNTRLLWCPSHVGIPGNEIADDLAHSAATEEREPDQPTKEVRNKLPLQGYFDRRWWSKRIKKGVQDTWQRTWDSKDSSLKQWKKSTSMWRSQLSGKPAAERLLAQLRLNRHSMLQPLPGKQQPQCRCNKAKLTTTHFVNECTLWTRQRSTLLSEVRATLQNPELAATSLWNTLLREHANAFTEWKMSDALWHYYSTTLG